MNWMKFTFVVLILTSLSVSLSASCAPRVFIDNDNAFFYLEPGDTTIVKKIHTEKNGFTYQMVEQTTIDTNYKYNHRYVVLSLIGDTLLTSETPIYYSHIDSPKSPAYKVYGGFFYTGNPYKTIYDMWGQKLIGEDRQITDCFLEMTADSIPYFKVVRYGKKIKNWKYGFYDITGTEIIPVKYKLLKDHISIENNSEGFINENKQQPLHIFLPKHIDYSQLRNSTAQTLKSSSYLNLPITEKSMSEKDGFNWILLSRGEYTGANDGNGNIIIPLSKEYKNVRYLSLGSNLGCFVFNKNNYACVSDLHGNIIVPPSRKYSRIKFEDGYGNDGTEIAGFFHAYKDLPQHKHRRSDFVEICDLAGKVVIPAERNYSMVKFWAVKNHVGYFCVYSDEDKVEDMKEGVCDLSGEEIIPLENEWVTYDVDKGFGCSAIKKYTGIRLDRNGLADYQLKLQWDKRKEIVKQQKILRRKKFLANFGQALFQGIAQGLNAVAYNQLHQNQMARHAQTTGNLASQMENPQYFNQMNQQLLALSISQGQYAEWQEYNQARAAYQRMGRDLTLDEFRALQGQAIMNLKEQGYDVIAEQKAINQELHNANRSRMNSGKENVQRIKEQNKMKYGTTHSSSSASSRTTSSNTSTYTTSKFRRTTSGNSTSTTSSATNNRGVSSTTSSSTKNNAHEQYKSGNLNTNTDSYGDRIKNVSMAVKDGSSYRNVSVHGELYKKGSQYFVKIGSSFFKVENTGGFYNSYIIYGAKAHYFNK